MTLAIHGFGLAVSKTAVDQEQAWAMASRIACRTEEDRAWLRLMFEQTGIRSRHIHFSEIVVEDLIEGTRQSDSVFLPRLPDDGAGPTTAQRMQAYHGEATHLAIQSCRQALRVSDVKPSEITHLVTVSCTGFAAPGVDCELIDNLKLSPDIARTNVGFMGCHGALNGLRVAKAYAESDSSAKVLLCATEICSVHFHYGWEPQKLVANALFADGSAALVASSEARKPSWHLVANGSYIVPDSANAMSWSIVDHGFEMTLSKQVPAIIATNLRPWLVEWLAKLNMRIEQIANWVVHPGGSRVLQIVQESLELSPDHLEASREVFAEYGNMSSPTVLFILERLARKQARGACVAMAFGPGMTIEAAYLEFR
ncbi:MAG: type III polyketide synthase [Gemmataceae bacterium]